MYPKHSVLFQECASTHYIRASGVDVIPWSMSIKPSEALSDISAVIPTYVSCPVGCQNDVSKETRLKGGKDLPN